MAHRICHDDSVVPHLLTDNAEQVRASPQTGNAVQSRVRRRPSSLGSGVAPVFLSCSPTADSDLLTGSAEQVLSPLQTGSAVQDRASRSSSSSSCGDSADCGSRPATPPQVVVRKRSDGKRVGFICESPGCVWCCPLCSRNYHNHASMTQHLRRCHDVVSFVVRCRQCRELFSNRRVYNKHVGSCRAPHNGDGTHVCTVCGDRYSMQTSLHLHSECCIESVSGPSQPETASVKTCRYCGTGWSSQMSLSQHIRNRHMAESQRDRTVELMGVRPSRQVWTEDRRQAFLDIADRVGWSKTLGNCHSSPSFCSPDHELQNEVSEVSVERGRL